MSKIVGIGACVMDTLLTVPSYPKEDTKLRALSSRPAGGGPAATGIVAAAKLGVDAAFIGVLVGAIFCANFDPIGSLDMVVNDGLVAAITEAVDSCAGGYLLGRTGGIYPIDGMNEKELFAAIDAAKNS